jgi:hypothetical protein
MNNTIFQSVKKPAHGFSINEEPEQKYNGALKRLKPTGKIIYSVWFDEFYGGDAETTDWVYQMELNSFNNAKAHIERTWGKIKLKR